MWLVVHDWGMNSITGGEINVIVYPSRPPDDLILPIILGATTAVIMVGIGVYLMRRNRWSYGS
jgi:hypothetical protein